MGKAKRLKSERRYTFILPGRAINDFNDALSDLRENFMHVSLDDKSEDEKATLIGKLNITVDADIKPKKETSKSSETNDGTKKKTYYNTVYPVRDAYKKLMIAMNKKKEITDEATVANSVSMLHQFMKHGSNQSLNTYTVDQRFLDIFPGCTNFPDSKSPDIKVGIVFNTYTELRRFEFYVVRHHLLNVPENPKKTEKTEKKISNRIAQ